jgi:hypothetical protein
MYPPFDKIVQIAKEFRKEVLGTDNFDELKFEDQKFWIDCVNKLNKVYVEGFHTCNNYDDTGERIVKDLLNLKFNLNVNGHKGYAESVQKIIKQVTQNRLYFLTRFDQCKYKTIPYSYLRIGDLFLYKSQLLVKTRENHMQLCGYYEPIHDHTTEVTQVQLHAFTPEGI